jgi:hypothetical protein
LQLGDAAATATGEQARAAAEHDFATGAGIFGCELLQLQNLVVFHNSPPFKITM